MEFTQCRVLEAASASPSVTIPLIIVEKSTSVEIGGLVFAPLDRCLATARFRREIKNTQRIFCRDGTSANASERVVAMHIAFYLAPRYDLWLIGHVN